MSRSWVEVDLGAVAANVKAMADTAVDAEICGVVKANGYGHGALAVAEAALAAGATRLAVAQVAEGVALRAGGIEAPIWVLSEPGVDEYHTGFAHGLEPTVGSMVGVEAAISGCRKASKKGGKAVVHLKVDTGMGRIGVWFDNVVDLATRIESAPGLTLGSVWTHFASADEPDEGVAYTDTQLDRYEQALARVQRAGIDPGLRHAANSAGIIAHPRSHFDVVRCGIAMYGLAPSAHLAGRVKLTPALRWLTSVGFVRPAEGGTLVSYGRRGCVAAPCRLATIPVGYADGYRRGLWNTGPGVLIGGKRRPIVGVVTMDQIVVNCGHDDVAPGDEVVLIGNQGDDQITADELAGSLGTINYEITTGIGARSERRYLNRQH